MPRRPDRTWAMLLAGLICLGVSISEQGWSREGISASVHWEESGKGPSSIASLSFQLASRQLSPEPPARPEGSSSAIFPKQSLGYHWLAGGFLGGLLCHYVYGYPWRYVCQEGLWPPGLLDILVLLALGCLGYRLFQRWRGGGQPPESDAPPRFLSLNRDTPPAITVREDAKPGVAAIQEGDQDFDIEAFGEETRQLLLELYAAWNREEVERLNGRVKDSLLEYLQMGLKIMSLREESSYLEDLVLEGMTITAARVDDGKDFITVCFRGRLLDYVLDKTSGKLLLGSLAYPATFQEYWDLERPRGQSAWVLQDIRDG